MPRGRWCGGCWRTRGWIRTCWGRRASRGSSSPATRAGPTSSRCSSSTPAAWIYGPAEERALRRRLEIENEARASEIAMLAERLRLEKEIDGLQRARGTQQQPDRPAALRSSYEIDPADLVQGKFLGAGSFGTVFEGTYQNHTRVAMKVVRIAGSSKNADRKRAEFVHEMAVWGSLPYHDNVLPLIGWCRKPVCMVTRLMEGTAAEYLERHAWDRRLTLDLLFQVAKGMNHLHSRPSPILHSDLKAANVLVDENGTAKVSDFGQSKVRRAATGGSVFMGGTPPFMAPEVWKGTRSRASDVYAFAMLAHELWSKGDLPFDDCGLGLHEFGERIAADPGFRPGRPDGCPEALWRLMGRCWAYEAAERPRFAEVADALKEMLDRQDSGFGSSA
ncbi:kinase-like domain-containing protein [Hyaloraphidium curvatum]|nr:kinase-like domain-containing protein [Hyaloraphidium curvatum]